MSLTTALQNLLSFPYNCRELGRSCCFLSAFMEASMRSVSLYKPGLSARSAYLTVVMVSLTWLGLGAGSVFAIDVKLTMEEAKKALDAGRAPMEKAAEAPKPDEEIRKIMKNVSLTTRIGADPEKDPCGASALLRTKRYRLE